MKCDSLAFKLIFNLEITCSTKFLPFHYCRKSIRKSFFLDVSKCYLLFRIVLIMHRHVCVCVCYVYWWYTLSFKQKSICFQTAKHTHTHTPFACCSKNKKKTVKKILHEIKVSCPCWSSVFRQHLDAFFLSKNYIFVYFFVLLLFSLPIFPSSWYPLTLRYFIVITTYGFWKQKNVFVTFTWPQTIVSDQKPHKGAFWGRRRRRRGRDSLLHPTSLTDKLHWMCKGVKIRQFFWRHVLLYDIRYWGSNLE